MGNRHGKLTRYTVPRLRFQIRCLAAQAYFKQVPTWFAIVNIVIVSVYTLESRL